MNTTGRPRKINDNDSRRKIVDSTVRIIKRDGVKNLTVRNICAEAGISIGTFYHFFMDKENLLMSFIGWLSFGEAELKTPLSDIAGRIIELYLMLIRWYMEFGRDFVKKFYDPGNLVLSAYIGERDGKFLHDTVMARSEQELDKALSEGIITLEDGMTPHRLAADICTIVKGCVFEWCLSDNVDLEEVICRIIRGYMKSVVKSGQYPSL